MMSKIVKKGYTFDDVLLIPAHSNVLPKETILKTKLTKDITLEIPIISSAMDTVTETKMAIAIARLGGIGFIHKNMSIKEQALAVKRVKLSEAGMITDPITLTKSQTLQDAEDLMAYYKISGFPVIEEDGTLIGILTNRDVRYREDLSYSVESTMTKKNLITAPVGISLHEAKAILLENRIEKLPIVDENNKLKGLITIKDIDKTRQYPQATKDSQGRLRCGAAVGVSDDTIERVKALVDVSVDVIAIDSAHGHSEGVIEMVKTIKNLFPNLPVVAGNIVTKEAASALIKAKADALKVGVGPGSICTTRVIAGVGVPQVSAIMDVYEIAKAHNIPVIADGGIKFSGDISKAIAAGADTVMLGSLLAGCEESPGEEIYYNSRRYKVYQGMGSISAMRRGSSDRYFQGNQTELKKLVPEGIEARVPYKGKVEDVIFQLIGGLRSSMGYCGTKTINDLKDNGLFVSITAAGQKESHPHSVELTQESPNYQKQ
ncbi:IMP dehydrogenase [Liberiplasma polymorphum]|uniref:IMP dehydrogenase n=1 Tax=Liberiplasma polymorphum TaxID=3374570 RepID=UPI0037746773